MIDFSATKPRVKEGGAAAFLRLSRASVSDVSEFLIVHLGIQFGTNCSAVNQSDASV